jgi:curli biogenesis system outer membrane secretion channel CsgG
MSTKAAAERLARRLRRLRRVAAACLLPLLGLAGCATVKPEMAQVVAQPKTPPVRNITSFSGALQCMDGLLANWGVRNVIITSSGIPDATGEISTGTREMLISAISRMSAKSNAFRYVDYDLTQVDVQQLHQLIDSSKSFVAPNYYIRGAITQLDQGVLDAGVGFGLSAGSGRSGADIGVNFNKVVSTVALDLNVVDFSSRQVVPGMYANSSLAVVRASKAADPGGRISKAGIFFNVALDQSEGMHQAVRTLVELNTIELLGKLAEVPYWKCLQIESTNPAALEQARDWYQAMNPQERLTFVQRALKGGGYYSGAVDGVMNQATSDAIANYQVDNQQIADGRIGFQLYMALLDAGKRLASADPPRSIKP